MSKMDPANEYLIGMTVGKPTYWAVTFYEES